MISHRHQPYEYSEYIPVMPAEQLIKAASLKQNMYDQNVEKLQTELDALGQVDLVRNSDREYYTQQAEKVYSAFKQNAHQDFSNPDVFRQVKGFVMPLFNDPVIRNAKLATAEFRNRQNTLNEIREKRPELYSADREWQYMNDAYEWISDTTPGKELSPKQYTPYRDVSKNWTDLYNKLLPDITTDVLTDPKAVSWSEETIKVMTQDRLRLAIEANLDEADREQIRNSANYSIAGVPQQAVVDGYRSTVEGHLRNSKQIFNFYNNKVKSGQPLTPAEQSAYETAEADVEVSTGELDLLQGDNSYNVAKNHMAKAYYEKLMNGATKAYSYKQAQTKLRDNPAYAIWQKHSADMLLQEQKQKDAKELVKTKAQYGAYEHKTGKAVKNVQVLPKGSIGNSTNFSNIPVDNPGVKENIKDAIRDHLSGGGKTSVDAEDLQEALDKYSYKLSTDKKGEPKIVIIDEDGKLIGSGISAGAYATYEGNIPGNAPEENSALPDEDPNQAILDSNLELDID